MTPDKRRRTFIIFLTVFSLLPLLPLPFLFLYSGFAFLAFAFEEGGIYGTVFLPVLIGLCVVHYIRLVKKCFHFYRDSSVLIGEQTFIKSFVLFSKSVFGSSKKAIAVIVLSILILVIFMQVSSMM